MIKPSVTQLTKLLDKPALMYWANKKGLEGFSLKDLRQKNTSKGISLHKQIQDYIISNKPILDKVLKSNIDHFLNSIDVLEIEKRVENKFIVGRLDILYKKNNKVFIGDFKTNQKSVYLENKLQLVAYSSFYDVDGYSIISIPKMEIIEINIDNIKPYKEILNSLYNIYKYKNVIDLNLIK